MCGIAGCLNSHNTADAVELQACVSRMAATLAHRGPDDRGCWVDPAAGVALGHRRLAILDLSNEGHQPMLSPSGRYVIVFNGEIYNFRELRADLESAGFRFRGHGDTEVMLAAFENWGLDAAVRRFNGMFAFALWDRSERLLHLVRDRLGEKPLYYGPAGRGFVFASELKALRAHPDFSAEIDRDSLAAFLRFSYVPAPASIYRNIRKLPPGCAIAVSAAGGAAPPRPYWSLRDAVALGCRAPFDGSDAEALSALEGLLQHAVGCRMIADVPLGALLSGGIDSSTVVALMQAQSARPVKTFTIGFREAGFDEAPQAAAVARHLGTEHTALYVTPGEAMDVIPRLPELYDEPFGDSSQIPTFLVCALARSSVTVSLSGDGGDEVFGGYTRHLWTQRVWSKSGWAPAAVRNAAAKAFLSVSNSAWSAILERAAPALPRGLRQSHLADKVQKLGLLLSAKDADAVYRSLVSQWPDPAAVVPGAVEPDVLAVHAEQCPSEVGLAEGIMYRDTVTYLPDDILAKVDRASMGVSLENRVPLLDHRVVEFAWRLPLRFKIRDGAGKWLLRQLLYRHIPETLVDRPKTGFAIPIDCWIRGPLRPWAEDLLAEDRIRQEGYFRWEPIRRTWAEHLSGRHNWSQPLWNVLMFQAWLGHGRASEPLPRREPTALAANS